MRESILITGATGKLGKVFVKYFLEKNYEVIALSRTKKKLDLLKNDLVDYADNLKLIEQNLMSKDFDKELSSKLEKQNLYPNCLINNARALENLKLEKDGSSSESALLDEYKLAVIVPYKLVLSLLKNENYLKKVVNISSIYGLVALIEICMNPRRSNLPIHYGLAKAAMIQLTKELAVRLSGNGVEVNCVAYGGVKGRVDKNFENNYSMLCPSGRMLNESELAAPLELLLSNQSNGINGHVLVVDGGWTVW